METADEEEKPSKSQRKRDMQRFRQIAEQLLELSAPQLADLNDPVVLDAVNHGKKITKGNARKRQIQYIAKLIRNGDPEFFSDFLLRYDPRSKSHQIKFRKLERWRDSLLNEPMAAFEEIITENPNLDRQQLRHLVRLATTEREQGEKTDCYRRLFQFLRTEIH